MKKHIVKIIILLLISLIGLLSWHLYQEYEKQPHFILREAKARLASTYDRKQEIKLLESEFGIQFSPDINTKLMKDPVLQIQFEDKLQRLLDEDSRKDDVILSLIHADINLNAPICFMEKTLLAQIVSSPACQDGKRAALLIAAGANVNAKMGEDMTALHWACQNYQCDTIIPLLIAEGADINATDIHGNTPLCKAVDINNYHAVRILIEHGARVDFQDEALKKSLEVTGAEMRNFMEQELHKRETP